jgi:hypothetical protein
MPRSIANISSIFFSSAFTAINVLRFWSTSSKLNSAVSTLSLPASMREKSRMSLMMPSKCSPAWAIFVT